MLKKYREQIIGIVVKTFLKLVKNEPATKNSVQKKILKNLLKKNKNTLFGKHYNFDKILSSKDFVNEYQRRIPFFNYESMYEQWWKLFKNKKNVCGEGNLKYFGLTSGTSGAPSKHIPVSQDMIESVKKAHRKEIKALSNYDLEKKVFTKDILHIGGPTKLERKGKFYYGDLSGIVINQIPMWFKHYYKPEKEITDKIDWQKKMNHIVKNAKNYDVGIIGGIPPWILMLFENIIKYHKVNDIHEIWPNFNLYIHGGVPFKPYEKQVNSFLGKPVNRLESYIASEGFIAFQVKPEENMRLLLDNGVFFEFVEFNDENFKGGKVRKNVDALTIYDVKKETPYALVLTNCSGAWRYLVGDVIKFTDLKTKQIKYVGRVSQYLSSCAEHVTPENLDDTISLVEKNIDVNILEFSVGTLVKGKDFMHEWFISVDKKVNVNKLKKEIDKNLSLKNKDYGVKRTGPLKEPVVNIVSKEDFISWMGSKGKLGGQNKIPKILGKDQHESLKKHLKL